MMATLSARRPGVEKIPRHCNTKNRTNSAVRRSLLTQWLLLAGMILFASLAVAQNAPQVTGVDPDTGKVNDTVTVSGSNLGKASVSSVYLSDDKNDYKATIVDQSDD